MAVDDQQIDRIQGVAVVVLREEELNPLLYGGYSIAECRDESLHVLVPSIDGRPPDWFVTPDAMESSRVSLVTLDAAQIDREIMDWCHSSRPAIVAFHFDRDTHRNRYIVNHDIDGAIMGLRCPVALISPGPDNSPDLSRTARALVPYSDDANSRYALSTALELNPRADLTVVGTGPEPADEEERIAREQEFIESLGDWASDPRVNTRLLLGDDAANRLVADCSNYDRVIIGAGRGNRLERALLGDRAAMNFGETANRIVAESRVPLVIVREYQGWLVSMLTRVFGRGRSLLPPVTPEERIDIYREIRKAAAPRIDFFVMIGLSAAIASLGMLLNSPAVIIGAMLIAPLMSAIIGVGLAMVQGNTRFLLSSVRATFKGALVAIIIGIIVGLTNISGQATSEMLARAGPNFLDLAVAALSGAAAAYALCRKNVSAALPGVAIAVALVPPLAATGLFLSIAQWQNGYAAFLLFLTNLATIALTSGIVFTMVGFRPTGVADQKMERYTTFRRGMLAIGLLVVWVLSNLTVREIDHQIEWYFESVARSAVEDYLASSIDREVHLIRMQIHNADPDFTDVVITASTTKQFEKEHIEALAELLARESDRDVRLTVITAPMVSAIATPDAPDN